MARRRRFYARDSHGRFSKTAGRKGTYKKKLSTRRKVAYGVAAAAVVGGAALGGRELYRAGGRKGYEYGRAQGIKTGKPLRGSKGRFLGDEHKRDSSQNPYARGYRPFGRDGRARKPPKLRTIRDRYRQWERRKEGVSPRTQGRVERNVRRRASAASQRARQRANARRYNDAQSRSQRVGNAARNAARRTGQAASGVDVRKLYSSAPSRRARQVRTNARINASVLAHSIQSNRTVTNARINSAVIGQQVRAGAAARKTARAKKNVRNLGKKR